jgi:uncharacterized membrane protein YidH (DUF202 family)
VKPNDAGLQLERTQLAWRRTCLALAVAGALAARFGGDLVGSVSIVFGVACVGAAAVSGLLSERRYLALHARFTTSVLTRSAAPHVFLAVAALALSVLGAAFVLAELT